MHECCALLPRAALPGPQSLKTSGCTALQAHTYKSITLPNPAASQSSRRRRCRCWSACLRVAGLWPILSGSVAGAFHPPSQSSTQRCVVSGRQARGPPALKRSTPPTPPTRMLDCGCSGPGGEVWGPGVLAAGCPGAALGRAMGLCLLGSAQTGLLGPARIELAPAAQGGPQKCCATTPRGTPTPPPGKQVFFDALLPPIIFNAGFSVKKKNFFRNFTTLALFGVAGTFMTAAMVAAGAAPTPHPHPRPTAGTSCLPRRAAPPCMPAAMQQESATY